MSIYRDFPDKTPFELHRPAVLQVPFLFNSPHSGRNYPRAFLAMSCLDAEEIRLSEDRYVDFLFADVTKLGAAFMSADFPRAYLDVNREAFELDAAMFCETAPDLFLCPTMRVQAGLGCVPRIVAANKPIYADKIPLHEAFGRISSIYKPYHDCLKREIEAIKKRFGYTILIDCHSMPGQLRYYEGEKQPDIILGDMHGRSCAQALMHCAAAILKELGYHVAHNQPYAGGYITAHYGQPASGCHTMQIEINRDLYLDPCSFKLTPGFAMLQHDMMRFAHNLVAMFESAIISGPEAAE